MRNGDRLMKMEKYSVLTSLYKKEKPEYLRIALDSMICQTLKADEIVLVEDGPLTDELYAILEEYDNNYPGLFHFVKNEKNIGLGLSLNNGLKECRNEIVARMDTDDIYLPYRSEKQMEAFMDDPSVDILSAYANEFYDDPNIVISVRKVPLEHEEIYEYAKRRSAFNHAVVMYKRSKVLENGGYSNLRRNQDVDLFGRMLFNGCKGKNLPEPLINFRSNGDLSKRRKSWENTWSYIDTIKKFWKMGYSSFSDYAMVAMAQTGMFIMPARIQNWLYRQFLRK